jgi:hypothetical protein
LAGGTRPNLGLAEDLLDHITYKHNETNKRLQRCTTRHFGIWSRDYYRIIKDCRIGGISDWRFFGMGTICHWSDHRRRSYIDAPLLQ